VWIVSSEMDAASTKEERTCGIHIKWEQVFDSVTMKIDGKFANVWLEGLPDLFAECSRIKVSELLGENVKVGSEEFFYKGRITEGRLFNFVPQEFC